MNRLLSEPHKKVGFVHFIPTGSYEFKPMTTMDMKAKKTSVAKKNEKIPNLSLGRIQ